MITLSGYWSESCEYIVWVNQPKVNSVTVQSPRCFNTKFGTRKHPPELIGRQVSDVSDKSIYFLFSAVSTAVLMSGIAALSPYLSIADLFASP